MNNKGYPMSTKTAIMILEIDDVPTELPCCWQLVLGKDSIERDPHTLAGVDQIYVCQHLLSSTLLPEKNPQSYAVVYPSSSSAAPGQTPRSDHQSHRFHD